MIEEINSKTHENVIDLSAAITPLAPWRVLGIDDKITKNPVRPAVYHYPPTGSYEGGYYGLGAKGGEGGKAGDAGSSGSQQSDAEDGQDGHDGTYGFNPNL